MSDRRIQRPWGWVRSVTPGWQAMVIREDDTDIGCWAPTREQAEQRAQEVLDDA